MQLGTDHWLVPRTTLGVRASLKAPSNDAGAVSWHSGRQIADRHSQVAWANRLRSQQCIFQDRLRLSLDFFHNRRILLWI